MRTLYIKDTPFAIFQALYFFFCKYMLKEMKPKRDPHTIYRYSVEKQLPRALKRTPLN